MKIKSSEFLTSSDHYKKCPKPDKAEFAFIGRSNVGKSSLINMLTDRKKLAKISSTPGKTQLINHFIINGKWYLVDLPGYGWAKVSKSSKMKWEKMIRGYILNRDNLVAIFVLVDCRLDPQTIDIDLVNWLGENGIPFVIVFTKADKLSNNKLNASIAKFKRELSETWEDLPLMISTSSQTKKGREEILDFIDETLDDVPFD
jgi:GTP-binding protein